MNLDELREQAKELADAARAGDLAAQAGRRETHPEIARLLREAAGAAARQHRNGH